MLETNKSIRHIELQNCRIRMQGVFWLVNAMAARNDVPNQLLVLATSAHALILTADDKIRGISFDLMSQYMPGIPYLQDPDPVPQSVLDREAPTVQRFNLL
ncbi:Aste57867_11376 [Aphanomyces stellatus]|uniref:Aste57867_11376 protein n=1 Tax=Aphanomyces stellatus TaxID=120398 RepID=A0A485KUN6_9STRA|nr:hypothetical protein As57867_011334 [Aphanomyces stellatus]VFT88238.1 Aste57867_11376 [Aphanomyces stellatus]